MKRCLSCAALFSGDKFVCPDCGHAPEWKEGFPSFAPGAVLEKDGFPVEAFENLFEIEDGSFWFRARNSLISWALDRFFPNCSNFFEVGCGTGYVLSGLARRRPDLTLAGSDLYFHALRLASKRLGNAVDLYQMDAADIPFEAEFDVIGAFDVLEHIEDDEAVLAQLCRTASSGGGVIVTVPQHMRLWGEIDVISGHKRRYSVEALNGKFKKAGLSSIYHTSFVTFLLPAVFLSRLYGECSLDRARRSLILPRPLDAALEALMAVERRLILAGVRLLWGSSLLMVGKKRR
ncbi:MAG: class I SAM-dependent methyltransferase [Proteobacteria bacterium]|nr:class I SAM-dependent methyltransferase [Pseudomonadota bacterium]